MASLQMTAFIGRRAEMRVLEDAYRSLSSAFVPIYGRRRIGKSELILQFLKGKTGIYHLGKQAPALLQIREFLQEAARVLDEPLLGQVTPRGWREAFGAVETAWKGKGKLVVALDEFQWTAEASPELPSLLQELWDRQWRKDRRIVLIVCGSVVGFMERKVLGEKSPLYGRRTAQIHLQPFGFSEAAAFHPEWSATDQARAYFICGGVPLYLEAFDPARSVEANIEATLLSEFAPLFREPDFLLREELREVHSYHALLLAVAAGNRTVRDIAQGSGLPERSLHYWLEQLVKLGYVARRYPLSRQRAPATQVHFVLEDPLLRFWFRFIFPHQSQILRLGPALALSQLVQPQLDSYFGGCFERLCREALPGLYAKEGIHAAVRVGEYWSKEIQIDVVGVREDRWIDLGECKWGPVTSTKALEAEVETKVRAFPNTEGDTIGRRLFVRRLPASLRAPKKSRAVQWHELADL